MNPTKLPTAALSLLAVSAVAFAVQSGEEFALPFEFAPNTPARASEVNANFAAIEGELRVIGTETLLLSDELDALVPPANVIQVASSGGEFDSVAEALASITDSSEIQRYLVQVGPGVFDESELSSVPPFVHLRGSGQGITLLRAGRSSSNAGTAAAVVELSEESRLSQLSVQNEGTGSGVAIAVFSGGTTRATVMSQVSASATGTGSINAGLSGFESDLTVERCRLEAAGATALNAGARFDDLTGPFSQPLIRDCTLVGDGPLNGFALTLERCAASIDQTTLDGDASAVAATVAGISRLQGCKVMTTGLNPWAEQTGSASLFSATTSFVAGNPIGLASQFKYVHCMRPNFDPVVNGTGSSIQ